MSSTFICYIRFSVFAGSVSSSNLPPFEGNRRTLNSTELETSAAWCVPPRFYLWDRCTWRSELRSLGGNQGDRVGENQRSKRVIGAQAFLYRDIVWYIIVIVVWFFMYIRMISPWNGGWNIWTPRWPPNDHLVCKPTIYDYLCSYVSADCQ